MENDARFRHELKYLISKRDMDCCVGRISGFAGQDMHARGGVYSIRSLYFDDMYHSAYGDKESGVSKRDKFRIRIYNMDSSYISLENKIKEGAYVRKESVRINVEECDNILSGSTDCLLEKSESVASDFALRCRINGLKPEIIVDYDRVPFVYEHGKVRITFDMNIRAACGYNIFDDRVVSYDVLTSDLLIMEVKYTEYLPDIFRAILPDESCRIAASKFVMSTDLLRRIMTK